MREIASTDAIILRAIRIFAPLDCAHHSILRNSEEGLQRNNSGLDFIAVVYLVPKSMAKSPLPITRVVARANT